MKKDNLEWLKELIKTTFSAGFNVAYIDLQEEGSQEEAERKNLLNEGMLQAVKKTGYGSKMLEEERKVYFILDTANANGKELKRLIINERKERENTLKNRGIKLTLSLKDAEALSLALDYIIKTGIIEKEDLGSLRYIQMQATRSAQETRKALSNMLA